MRSLGLKHVGLLALLGVVLLSGYHFYRQKTAQPLAGQLHELREKITRQQLAELEVLEQSRLLPRANSLAALVASLYDCAQSAGVVDHEVTTSKVNNQPQARRSRKNRQVAGEELKVNRLQISLHGDFRAVAEYLRAVQALEQPQQIVNFELTPDQESIKMSLTLDLYTLKGLDES